MAAFRAVLIAITVLAVAASPLVVPTFDGSQGVSTAYAALTGGASSTERVQHDNDDNGNHNDNDDNDNDDNGNHNGNGNDNDDNENDNDDNGNGNDNDDDDNGNDNDDDDWSPVSPILVGRPGQAAAPAAPSCSTPGSEAVFTSSNGNVAVKVFPSMTRGVNVTIRSVDPSSVPAAPGQRVGALVYGVMAVTCDGQALAMLPAEVNLGIRYTDGDAGSLNEANFKIAQLDPSTDQWKDVAKQAPDPGANYVSATITDMGFFAVYVK